MACRQDKRLTQHKIYVDKIRKHSSLFLTHAHRDHFTHLSKSYTGKIYCTDVTKKLMCYKLHIPPEVFHVLHYYEATDVIDNIRVTAYPAYHCDGSAMYLFQINNETILYTGDFRWIEGASRLPPQVDIAYYDDTFANFLHVPTHQETLNDFLTLWYGLSNKPQIYIHAKVLGFEVILRAIVALGIVDGYQVSPHLPPCRRQDFNLLAVPINQTSKLILGDRHKDAKHEAWIVPSMTSQICPRFKQRDVYSLPFATHGGRNEIAEIKKRAKHSVPCQFTIHCQK